MCRNRIFSPKCISGFTIQSFIVREKLNGIFLHFVLFSFFSIFLALYFFFFLLFFRKNDAINRMANVIHGQNFWTVVVDRFRSTA